ncbi:hypothetical protein HanRHA438_Chr13g0590231 [Helianthus annuus]|nr:hypothetical protein HanRHA438_Chr13g0590231 [Helianthus annuus]
MCYETLGSAFQARHQAEKKKEEEAKAIALEAEKAAKEAAEMVAAESQRKAAEALTASQGAVSKESGFGRLNKAPEGNVLKGAESALKMEESRLQIYNEVVGKGFASEMDSNREYSRQGMQMARRIKTITDTKESIFVQWDLQPREPVYLGFRITTSSYSL